MLYEKEQNKNLKQALKIIDLFCILGVLLYVVNLVLGNFAILEDWIFLAAMIIWIVVRDGVYRYRFAQSKEVREEMESRKRIDWSKKK